MNTHPHNGQKGAALLLLMVMLGMVAVYFGIGLLNRVNQRAEQSKASMAALAQAREALVGFASGVTLTPAGAPRPGDLPCPDSNNDGIADAPCGNAAGTTGQALRLGRLPWKTLGLPDLRDGSGERLWYAVSSNFKNSTRNNTILLNSDTSGTITVRAPDGSILNDGSGTTGAVAVIIAPGNALTRSDAVIQNRAAGAAALLAINFLDLGSGEDNAAFVDGSTNGFINGEIHDVSGNVIVNDMVLAITPADLMPALEKRVAGEVATCLSGYAANAPNQGRYPWAAPLNPLVAPSYVDTAGSRFGRIPDTLFNATRASSGALHPMDDSWTGACNIASGAGWWLNWKEMVFYALADAFRPVSLDASPPAPACVTSGTCLTVNPPAATASVHFAVLVAGRRLPGVAGGQPRTSNADRGTIANYLEGENTTPVDDLFAASISSALFNDRVTHVP